jgi:hypothetical protein
MAAVNKLGSAAGMVKEVMFEPVGGPINDRSRGLSGQIPHEFVLGTDDQCARTRRHSESHTEG